MKKIKPKIVKDPINILAHITILGGVELIRCLEIIFSIDQNKVAINIRIMPASSVINVILSNKRLDVRSTNPARIKFLDIFSFKKMLANKNIQMNMVFCTKDEPAGLVKDKPLKNNRNGMPPPKIPTNKRDIHCFLERNLNFFQSLAIIMLEQSTRATIEFFKKVKIYALPVDTPYLLINMEKPEIIAVLKIRISPLLLFIV